MGRRGKGRTGRRRAGRRLPLWLSGLLPLILLVVAMVAWHAYLDTQQRRFRMLIDAAGGGGEVRYVAVGWRHCRSFPWVPMFFEGSPRPRLIPQVFFGDRLEVVARRDGWALAGHEDYVCWVPEWTLRDRPPVRQPDDYARPPPGWED